MDHRKVEDMTGIVPLLRNTGEPLAHLPAPDARKLKGVEHKEALVAFLVRVSGVVRLHTTD